MHSPENYKVEPITNYLLISIHPLAWLYSMNRPSQNIRELGEITKLSYRLQNIIWFIHYYIYGIQSSVQIKFIWYYLDFNLINTFERSISTISTTVDYANPH